MFTKWAVNYLCRQLKKDKGDYEIPQSQNIIKKEDNNMSYKVWECHLVISKNKKLPDGFNTPPRRAAIEAVEKAGIEVLACFSGWGGSLTKTEREVMETSKII